MKNKFISKDEHDANEFILFLFDKLQDEQTLKFVRFDYNKYKDPKIAWRVYSKDHQSIIDRLFVGMYEKQLWCKNCENKISIFELFNYIQLNWHASNLKDSYHEHYASENEGK